MLRFRSIFGKFGMLGLFSFRQTIHLTNFCESKRNFNRANSPIIRDKKTGYRIIRKIPRLFDRLKFLQKTD